MSIFKKLSEKGNMLLDAWIITEGLIIVMVLLFFFFLGQNAFDRLHKIPDIPKLSRITVRLNGPINELYAGELVAKKKLFYDEV